MDLTCLWLLNGYELFLLISAIITVSARQSRVGNVIYHVTVEDRDSQSLTVMAKNHSGPFQVMTGIVFFLVYLN